MGSKFLVVPADAKIVDPDAPVPPGPDGKPGVPIVVDTVSFARAIHLITRGLVRDQQMDMLDAIDLRAKVNASAVGGLLELTDEEHATILPQFKRTKYINGELYGLCGGEEHLRAVVEAKSKRPATSEVAEPAAN